jgi:hypothetical protein
LHRRAVQYRDGGQHAEAEPLFRQVLEGYRRQLGPDHPDTLACMQDLGELYRALGRYEEVVALLQQVLEGRRRLGPVQAETLGGMDQRES